MTGEWRTDAPDWRDVGLVELRLDDGTTVRGDMTFDCAAEGEGDAPAPVVDVGNGIKFDFWSAEAWRLLEEDPPEW